MALSCSNFYCSTENPPVSAKVSDEVVGPKDDEVDGSSMTGQNG